MASEPTASRLVPRWVVTTWVGLLLCVASPALAASPKTCPTDRDRAVLTKFGDRVAQEETAGEAQELAMSKLRVGRTAIRRARSIIPGESTALAEAEQRLDTLELAVLAGTTPAEVAAPFQRMAQAEGRCQYNTAEIVVIVVGFVLGIIPGVIFLFLLC